MNNVGSPPCCSHLKDCGLFPLIDQPGFLRIWKISYCEAEFAKCARFQLSTKGKHVSDTLLPNGKELSAPLRAPPK